MLEQDLFNLTVEQSFQLEHYSRLIDKTTDVKTLRSIAKLMLQSYQKQRAATQWVMKKSLLDTEWGR
jgi:hypothetical protein